MNALIISKPKWQRNAACKGLSPAMFHDYKRTKTCLGACNRCTVRQECLEYAEEFESYELDSRCIVGIYGGTTPAQRIEKRKNANSQG
jgi:hypothetical protein